MSGTYSTQMGDRGRLVVPVELRDRLGLHAGVHVLLVDTDDGVVLVTREQAHNLMERQLSGTSLVDTLLADRRLESTREDG